MSTIKWIFAFLFIVVANSCIDPYKPGIANYNAFLVVEGLITNESSPYKINLHRTTKEKNSIPEKVIDANVYILSEDGIRTHLRNIGGGTYITDSASFKGAVGKNYILQILTSDGKEYRSDECMMLPVAAIDSVYYEKGEEISGNLGESFPGLKILLNSVNTNGYNQYFRWTFEEAWKFLVPIPQRYNCKMVLNGETYIFEQVPVQEICWRRSESEDILTNSVNSGQKNFIDRQEIHFIDPVKSDRLTQQYSILVKQYSISKKEFDFWNDLKKVNDSGGDIFASLPYTVISNVHNVNDASEKVLGYFEVSAVNTKRIFITADDLDQLYLPQYKSGCVEIARSPEDWPIQFTKAPVTYYDIYYKIMYEYTFIMPLFNPDKTLRKLVFATPACSLCDLTGLTSKPDFWIDKK